MMDWSNCPDVERIPGKVSGARLVKGTSLPVDAILANADDYTPEEIATEIFQEITPKVSRRIIGFAVTAQPACSTDPPRRTVRMAS
jgi:uncharacterized protein (DUF433 family)